MMGWNARPFLTVLTAVIIGVTVAAFLGYI